MISTSDRNSPTADLIDRVTLALCGVLLLNAVIFSVATSANLQQCGEWCVCVR